MDLNEAGERLFGGEANTGVAFQMLYVVYHSIWQYVHMPGLARGIISQYVLHVLCQGGWGDSTTGNSGVYRWKLCETQDPCQAYLRHCLQPKLGSVRQSVRLEGAWHDTQPEKKLNTRSDGYLEEGPQAQTTSCMYHSRCRDGEQVLYWW